MQTLRYEHRYAKRDHKAACEMTGLPIEKGDRFFEGTWVDGRYMSHIKALSVIQEMAVADLYPDEGWDPTAGPDYLITWLREHLGWDTRDEFGLRKEHPDVEACYQAAMAFWWPKKSSSE